MSATPEPSAGMHTGHAAGRGASPQIHGTHGHAHMPDGSCCGHGAHGEEHSHHHEGHAAHAREDECCGHSHHADGHAHGHASGDCCGGHGEAAKEAAEQEWTRRFFLFLELAVLLVWAVMMVWFYASGRINSYLIGEGTFRIQVLIGGLILAVLGFFNWQMRAIPEDCGHDHGPEGCSGHDHAHGGAEGHPHDHAHHHHNHNGTAGGRGLALALLALSVTASVAMTPDDFSDQYKKNMLTAYASRPGAAVAAPEQHRLVPDSSVSAAGGGASGGGLTLATIEKYQKRNQDGNFELDVMQLYYSGSDPEYAKVMQGQGVETVGQVVRDTSGTVPNRWRVFVLQMTCCAADARPYSLPVDFEGAVPDLQEMGWFRIKGTIEYQDDRGVTIAVLKATAAEPTLRPKELRTMF